MGKCDLVLLLRDELEPGARLCVKNCRGQKLEKSYICTQQSTWGTLLQCWRIQYLFLAVIQSGCLAVFPGRRSSVRHP
jgi:hypothetical protein